MLLLIIFQNQLFSKHSFRNTIRVSNGLDPDQGRRFVGPCLGPNCLQRLSADDTSGQRVNAMAHFIDTKSILVIVRPAFPLRPLAPLHNEPKVSEFTIW